MTREETLKGLNCCTEFECGECPYKIYSHDDYKFRCNYRLISDLKEIMPKTGTWTDVSVASDKVRWKCSVCGKETDLPNYEKANYCFNCGAKTLKE